MFKSDFKVPDGVNEEPEFEEEPEDKSLSLSAVLDDMAPKPKNKKKKQFDLDDPNFKIEYREFAQRIYDEIENNAKLAIEGSFEVLRKVFMLIKLKSLSLYEAFVYFDVNNQNRISNMEIRLGLQNLDIVLEKFDFNLLWNVIEKNKDNKITYYSFFTAF